MAQRVATRHRYPQLTAASITTTKAEAGVSVARILPDASVAVSAGFWSEDTGLF